VLGLSIFLPQSALPGSCGKGCIAVTHTMSTALLNESSISHLEEGRGISCHGVQVPVCAFVWVCVRGASRVQTLTLKYNSVSWKECLAWHIVLSVAMGRRFVCIYVCNRAYSNTLPSNILQCNILTQILVGLLGTVANSRLRSIGKTSSPQSHAIALSRACTWRGSCTRT
jgi:hypothetical protein